MRDINFAWDENKNEINKKNMAYLSRKQEKYLKMIMLFCSMTQTILLKKKDF